jgi:hypothetical protein
MAKAYSGEINLAEYLDADELDAVRTVLAYILMKNTDLDGETIYSLVFQGGDKIIWH